MFIHQLVYMLTGNPLLAKCTGLSFHSVDEVCVMAFSSQLDPESWPVSSESIQVTWAPLSYHGFGYFKNYHGFIWQTQVLWWLWNDICKTKKKSELNFPVLFTNVLRQLFVNIAEKRNYLAIFKQLKLAKNLSILLF